MAAPARIQIADVDGVKVIRFNDHQLFDERTVREVAEQIAISLPNDGTPIRLVLDFSDVSLISSTLLSKLILIQRRVDASRGKLRLCELSPDPPAGLPHLEPRSPVRHRPRPADIARGLQ